MSRRKKEPAPAPTAWAGWYALDGSFWAAWWTGEPCASPWRSPDGVGSGDGADAERRIRKAKGAGAWIRQVGAEWARAARRESGGGRPNYREPPPPPRVADVFRQSPRRKPRSAATEAKRKATADHNHRARMYWTMRDVCTEAGAAPISPSVFGFATTPARPRDMGPEPAPRPAVAQRPSATSSFAALGLTEAATADDVRRAYRRAVAVGRLHPDHGGDPSAFRQITAHRDIALAHAERRGGFH